MRVIASRLLIATTCAAVHGAAAQRFYYPMPPASAVRITRDVRFATDGELSLAMDVYQPAKATTRAPALILFNPFWTSDHRSTRASNTWATSWAKVAAGAGIVAIIPDIRAEEGTGNSTTPTRASSDDFLRAVAFISEHASRYGIDRERLAAIGASGGVAAALPAVEDPRAAAIKAAVMYYGSGNVSAFRTDLPLLVVRAGLDAPDMNAAIMSMVSTATAQNAPVSLINYHTGYHAFEGRNDDVATRHVIEQTIDFVKRATTPAYQSAIRERQLDAVAAAQTAAGEFDAAAQTYARLLERRPADGSVKYARGRALLNAKQYGAACTTLRGLSPISFETILPATRACVLSRNADSAVVWLQTIRKDWFQSEYLSSLKTDSVFAALWPRADFQALFRP